MQTSPVPLALPVFDPSSSLDERQAKLVSLQAELREARVNHRKQRDDQHARIAQELQELAQTRNEIEEQQTEVKRERERLLALRERFVKRWKKHWSTQRTKLQREIKEFHRERTKFEEECATFEFHKSRFETYWTQEQENIRKRVEKLSEDEANRRVELARQEEQAEKRRSELESWAAELAAEQQQFAATRLQVEQRCARLRVEAEGLESRVVNSRAVLLHLEQQREILTAHLPEAQVEPEEARSKAPPEGVSQRRDLLVPVMEELADQRLTLVEQLQKLTAAREQWQQEQNELVSELAALAEKLSQQESDLERRHQAILLKEDRLQQDSQLLKRLKDDLEGRQSRHAVREMTARADRHRAELEMTAKIEWVSRREQSVTELYRRWSERRRAELVNLRTEHARCLELRQRWTEMLLVEEQKQADQLNHRRDLAEQALILEHAKQELLENVEDTQLGKRKLERLARNVRSATAKMEQMLTDHRDNLQTERKQLEALFRATLERIEELHARERWLADQLAGWESQQTLLVHQVEGHARQEAVWRAQRQVYQHELRKLQVEVDRLTEYLLQNRPDFIPLARAA
jgi:hypothetical protein